jgi:hypothetical protein
MRLIIATLTALCLSVGVQANPITVNVDNPNVAVEELGDKKIQLKLFEIPEGKILVTFKNKSHRVIFKDVIESGQFSKKNYDLNYLDNGDYSVEIFSKEHGVLENFDLSLGVRNTVNQYFAKTKVISDNNVAFLVKTEDDVNKKIRIYHSGHLVHEEDFTGDTFGKVFRFERVRSLNDITFEITNDSGFGKYVSAK